MDHVAAARGAIAEPMEEDEEQEEDKEDIAEGFSTEDLVPKRCLRHGQPCLQYPGFGQLAQITRWLGKGQLLAQGARGRRSSCRWGWYPWLRPMKS